MAGQNNFLIFDENRENLLSQEVYVNDQARTDGFKKGLARSNVNNKVLYQTSKMCHALGELIADNGDNASDESSVDELKQNLKDMFVSFGGENGHAMFDVILKDHTLDFYESKGLALLGSYVYKTAIAGSRFGYPSFFNKCIEEQAQGERTEVTLGENTVTMYINANGHQFFDIADKSKVDVFYNATGTAWFYGVDTANERILLPRNDYYFKNGSVENVGNNIEAGLPNITGSFPSRYNEDNTTGAFYQTNVKRSASSGTGSSYDIGIDASLSNPIYGNSDTVQPASVSVLAYMVVGNTEVESSITDFIDVTTSENDTLPLFHNFWSKEDMTTTGCYVNASLGGWLSGNVYTTAYNTLVQKLGTGNVKSVSGAYTDYDFVINADDMTFRLPLKNGQEIMFATGVKGNGLVTGMTDGTNYGGFASGGNVGQFGILPSKYGRLVSTSEGGTVGMVVTSTFGLTEDASMSGIILDTENITIPEGWNLYYKVANSVQNLQLLNAVELANSKANLDLSNTNPNASFRRDSVRWGIPDYSKQIEIEVAKGLNTYIAPYDGVIYGFITVASALKDLTINGIKVYSCKISTGTYSFPFYFQVYQGDVITISYYSITDNSRLCFAPFRE